MSRFAAMAAHASASVLAVYGDDLAIGSTAGVGVVIPDSELAIGGGVQLINGAHLMIRAADFPGIAVHSTVTAGGDAYVVMELDDIDVGGWRRARMALA